MQHKIAAIMDGFVFSQIFVLNSHPNSSTAVATTAVIDGIIILILSLR